jgi:hypothetical protein
MPMRAACEPRAHEQSAQVGEFSWEKTARRLHAHLARLSQAAVAAAIQRSSARAGPGRRWRRSITSSKPSLHARMKSGGGNVRRAGRAAGIRWARKTRYCSTSSRQLASAGGHSIVVWGVRTGRGKRPFTRTAALKPCRGCADPPGSPAHVSTLRCGAPPSPDARFGLRHELSELTLQPYPRRTRVDVSKCDDHADQSAVVKLCSRRPAASTSSAS